MLSHANNLLVVKRCVKITGLVKTKTLNMKRALNKYRLVCTIRFVSYNSYSGVCDQVNTRKKRQISNFAISERVKI